MTDSGNQDASAERAQAMPQERSEEQTLSNQSLMSDPETQAQAVEQTKEQSEDAKLVAKLTAIVREADRAFEKSGGGSRHWVRDWFLPVLNREGLALVRTEPYQCRHCDEDIRLDGDGEWIDRETHTTCKGRSSRHEPMAALKAQPAPSQAAENVGYAAIIRQHAKSFPFFEGGLAQALMAGAAALERPKPSPSPVEALKVGDRVRLLKARDDLQFFVTSEGTRMSTFRESVETGVAAIDYLLKPSPEPASALPENQDKLLRAPTILSSAPVNLTHAATIVP